MLEDPLFGLACHALLNSCTFEDRVYTAEPTKISSYMNAFLKRLGDRLGLALSSHSCRHSAVGFCCSHFQVLIHWVIQKGNWVLDSLNTFFEYLAFSARSDIYVSRILSGYAEIDRGILLYVLIKCRGSSAYIQFNRRR